MTKQKEKKQNMSSSERIQRLQSFAANPDWAFLRYIMQTNVEFLDDQILTKRSAERGSYGERLTDEEIDRLRDKRELQMELMNLPENIISQLTKYDYEDDELDPFPQDNKDLLEMDREEQVSRSRKE